MLPSVSEDVKDSPMPTVIPMGNVQRRRRGTGLSNVQTNYSIPAACKAKLHTMSERMGISDAQGLELLIDNLELEADGLPAWADRSQIPEALPIAKAS
jgi:hypothetical protein